MRLADFTDNLDGQKMFQIICDMFDYDYSLNFSVIPVIHDDLTIPDYVLSK